MLSSGELVELREFVEANVLPSTCTVQVESETNDKGSVTRTWANTYTGVACRIMPAGRDARQYVTGEKVTRIAEYVGTFPAAQALAPGYRIVSDGVTYEVLGVWEKHDFRTANRADLVRVI
ncbi:MAG TPA: hypothetical protein PK530_00670 [Anaerolineales bacterium]|nr:hypothetical protein [Anaerolineales bacterium]